MKRGRERERVITTWELPWFTLVKVYFSYGSPSEGAVQNLFEKVVRYELLVSRVEPKARWQMSFSVVQVVVGGVHEKRGRRNTRRRGEK